MLLHERHDHVDEICERPHGETDLFVVVGLTARVSADEPDTEEIVEEVAGTTVRRTKPYGEGEGRRCARDYERALRGDEAAGEGTLVSSRWQGSSGNGRARRPRTGRSHPSAPQGDGPFP